MYRYISNSFIQPSHPSISIDIDLLVNLVSWMHTYFFPLSFVVSWMHNHFFVLKFVVLWMPVLDIVPATFIMRCTGTYFFFVVARTYSIVHTTISQVVCLYPHILMSDLITERPPCWRCSAAFFPLFVPGLLLALCESMHKKREKSTRGAGVLWDLGA